jgi:uncharacterized protein (TIGR00255 family)
MRLPNGFDALEPALRDAAGKVFKRGNISATLNIKREEKTGPRLTPDPAALDQALRLVLELAARIPGAPPPRAEALLALPGVLRAETAELDEAAEEARRVVVAKGFTAALQALAKSRAAEGARLAEILGVLIDEIAALVTLSRDAAADQPAQQKARLRESLAALLEGERRVPEERLAAEVALLAAKSDVREEIDRLNAHIAEARALLASGDAVGRRLEFLTQEFVREANTLCSKSATVALTRLGLDMKAAIERLREQAANVE